jgi:hypothetical protein
MALRNRDGCSFCEADLIGLDVEVGLSSLLDIRVVRFREIIVDLYVVRYRFHNFGSFKLPGKS